MLRCTLAGLIPLMNSAKYAAHAAGFFQEKRSAFEAIIEHKSYYILRTLPADIARALLMPVLPALLAKQMKNGLWRAKNAAKVTYDVLSALDHAGLLDMAQLSYSPLLTLTHCHDEYALLVKRQLNAETTEDDAHALDALKRIIAKEQAADGSFGATVTGTVIQLDRLLDLGMSQQDPAILRGAQYLLSQRKPLLQGMHTSEPYSLAVEHVFTTGDRSAEFQAALDNRPEWLPRHVCFHTMAMIPNAVCLTLLLRLGLETDPGVTAALDSLFALYKLHGGLCATDIKKPYL